MREIEERRSNELKRRTVLKSLGASAVGTVGIMAGVSPATASGPITVRIKRDYDTSFTLAQDVRDAFNNAASSELAVTVEAEDHGTVSVDTVWDNFYDKKGLDAYDGSSTRGFRHYIEDSDYYSWSEGTCYIWLTDYDKWPGDNGNAVGSAFGDSLFDHECTGSAPHWAAGSADSVRDSANDVIGTFMHEFGHISMHSDHNHHQIYDYDTSWSGDVTTTSCMTVDGDEGCTHGEEGSYANTDFGPTMADCIEALADYQSPKFEHDATCQVRNYCHDGWQLTSTSERTDDTFGPNGLPVEEDAIVDNFPGEPPAIE